MDFGFVSSSIKLGTLPMMWRGSQQAWSSLYSLMNWPKDRSNIWCMLATMGGDVVSDGWYGKWWVIMWSTLKKLSKGAPCGMKSTQDPLIPGSFWQMSAGKCVWLIFKDSIKFTVVGLEDDVIGLREAHDEDEIDDKESEKVFGDHPVYHDHKGADDLKCPGMMSHRVCLKY